MTDFEEVYKTYFSDVFAYILSLSGNEHTAEEITSETFFRAMNKIDEFRGECSIRVWLCQIAKNCYYSYLKKEKRHISLETAQFPEQPVSDESVEKQIFQKDEARRIREILHTVKETYREVFMWRVFAELSFKEIGEIFGKSDHWACVTFHRACDMIKNRLEESDNEK